jgi:outer membrane protein, multidrug efflux system
MAENPSAVDISRTRRMNQLARSSNTRQQGRALAIAIACGFLLVLPSCGIPNLRPPQPGPGLPEKYDVRRPASASGLPEVFPEDPREATGSGNSSKVGIEEFFHDENLTFLIRQALAGNQEQKILIQDVQIAANEILARQGAFLPFLSVGGNAGLNKVSTFTLEGAGLRDDPFRPGQFFKNPHGNYELGLDLTWQIDIWRQLRNARDAAIRRFLATNEGRNYAVTRLVAEIADKYYELLALDKRLEILDQIIALQEQSLRVAEAKKEFARDTELPVQRFRAEVRKNQSQKLIINQEIVQVENRINFLVGRYPQRVERMSGDFIALSLPALSLGVPAQLLQNRPDIRQAERELEAAGLDVNVARKNFYPRLILNGGVGYGAFNPKYLFITPEALIGNLAGDLVAPLVNRKAIQAEYLSANSRQLQAVYNYQRVVLNAFTQVVNRMSKVQNYGRSIEIKKEQVAALELSVELASRLFESARAEYVDVLFAQRDLNDARTALVETKQEQLAAIVDTYQALGGGNLLPYFSPDVPQPPHWWKHFTHAWASHTR